MLATRRGLPPRSPGTPLVAVLCAAFAALPAAGSRRSLAACSCDCCVAEPRRESAVDGEEGWECALEQRGLRFESSPFHLRAQPCDSLCLQGPGDEVFTSTESAEVDAQQYCFVACAPKDNGEEAPQQGDLCKPVQSIASAALHRGGGPRPPGAPQRPAAAHLLLARSGARSAAGVGSAAAAPSPAAVGGSPAATPWSSVKDPAPEKYMRITEQATEIKRDYEKVEKGANVELKKFNKKALDAVTSAVAAVTTAREAAQKAEASERKVRALRDNLRRLAHDEAFRQIPKVLGPLVRRARAAAKRKAMEEAAKIERKMRIEAPMAAKKAAAPYRDLMHRAAQTAEEYAQRGTELVNQAQASQIEAQAFERYANVRSSRGDSAEAKRLMRRAKTLAGRAARMMSEANSFYKTSKTITDVNVPEYAREAGQAAYHAEVMANPDTEPPIPPVV